MSKTLLQPGGRAAVRALIRSSLRAAVFSPATARLLGGRSGKRDGDEADGQRLVGWGGR